MPTQDWFIFIERKSVHVVPEHRAKSLSKLFISVLFSTDQGDEDYQTFPVSKLAWLRCASRCQRSAEVPVSRQEGSGSGCQGEWVEGKYVTRRLRVLVLIKYAQRVLTQVYSKILNFLGNILLDMICAACSSQSLICRSRSQYSLHLYWACGSFHFTCSSCWSTKHTKCSKPYPTVKGYRLL